VKRLACVVLLAAACGNPAPPPRGPERDLDAVPHRPDAAITAQAAPDASAGSATTVQAPDVDDAERAMTVLAADLRAAITAGRIEPAADLDPRCHALDRALDDLRPRVASTARAAAIVRASSSHAAALAKAIPIEELGAVLDTCRARKQIELPGIESMIDDLEALVADGR
jgi:hypothetical protein